MSPTCNVKGKPTIEGSFISQPPDRVATPLFCSARRASGTEPNKLSQCIFLRITHCFGGHLQVLNIGESRDGSCQQTSNLHALPICPFAVGDRVASAIVRKGLCAFLTARSTSQQASLGGLLPLVKGTTSTHDAAPHSSVPDLLRRGGLCEVQCGPSVPSALNFQHTFSARLPDPARVAVLLFYILHEGCCWSCRFRLYFVRKRQRLKQPKWE